MLDALTENTHFQGSPKLSQVRKLREGAVQELQGQKQMFEEEARGYRTSTGQILKTALKMVSLPVLSRKHYMMAT